MLVYTTDSFIPDNRVLTSFDETDMTTCCLLIGGERQYGVVMRWRRCRGGFYLNKRGSHLVTVY